MLNYVVSNLRNMAKKTKVITKNKPTTAGTCYHVVKKKGKLVLVINDNFSYRCPGWLETYSGKNAKSAAEQYIKTGKCPYGF